MFFDFSDTILSMSEFLFDTNLHTHTWRCGHASGTEREYIENAISEGFKTLGFSDHTPQFFPGDYYSVNVRMRPSQMDDYVQTLLDLKREYASDIDIHLGLEVEYFPKIWDKLMNFLDQYPLEYFILGQHFTYNECDGDYCGAATSDFSIMQTYVSQTLEAMSSGRFNYLAHPDLIHFKYSDAESFGLYKAEMTRLCEGIKAMDLPIEINMLGVWQGRWYPNMDFWKIAGEVGVKTVIGSDAHRPDKIGCAENMPVVKDMVEKFSLNLVRPEV